jgi:hypothetical protein
VAPDRTALAAGVGGLAATAASAVTRAVVAREVPGATAPFTVATLALATISMVGFFLGVLAVWSAIKAWLRDDHLNLRARWGAGLGMAARLLGVGFGPCGPVSCFGGTEPGAEAAAGHRRAGLV